MASLFCRHNRFTADCPICSKNSVLARPAAPERAKPAPRAKAKRPAARAAGAAVVTYPHVSVGPIEHDARIYEVRLEQVPGGLRLGQWRGGELERKAPVMPASSLRELFDDARGRGFVRFDLPEGGPAGGPSEPPIAASAGRAGDMQEELRLVRRPEAGFVQVARWVFWPGDEGGWQLQDAPVMLPEKRFEQVLSDAALKGLI